MSAIRFEKSYDDKMEIILELTLAFLFRSSNYILKLSRIFCCKNWLRANLRQGPKADIKNKSHALGSSSHRHLE